MFPVEHKTAQGLYVAIAISMAIVFVIDLYTPLGIAVWVIYFVPLTLSFFTWRPLIPVALAVLATILMAIDFAIDPNPVGISPKLAVINRGFDILTVWIVAGVGHLFISSKLAVRREEWLQAGQVGLTEKMGGELRLEQLGENVLRFLAEYLDAQAGRSSSTTGTPSAVAAPMRRLPAPGRQNSSGRETGFLDRPSRTDADSSFMTCRKVICISVRVWDKAGHGIF